MMIFRWLAIITIVIFLLAATDSLSPTEDTRTSPPPQAENIAPEDAQPKEITDASEVTEEETEVKMENETEVEQTQEDPETSLEASVEKTEVDFFSEAGIASHYGTAWNSKTTASGEILDNNALQAAHKTLPFGTEVKVSRADDPAKTVTVEIVDRGPYVEGRVIDLTPAAFEKLAPLSRGVIEVELEARLN